MKTLLVATFLFFCTVFSSAQTPKPDQALLGQIRDKYDAPLARNLQSFECSVQFNWKQHWTETLRVGDEGTDEEQEKFFQPLANRVNVTAQTVNVSADISDEAIDKLPHGGMAERLLEHAVQKSLYTWLPSSMNMIIPSQETPVAIEQSTTGYKLAYKMGSFDVEMLLASDMRMQSVGVKASPADRIETSFEHGPHGFHLTSLTIGEDGNTDPGHRLIFTYSYQTVDGFELPENVVINRESHHEVWRYKLSGCSIKTSK